MEEVDVVEILKKELMEGQWFLSYRLNEAIIKAMKKACYQTVDLCTENAETCKDSAGNDMVDSDSILKTKEQII